MSKYEGLLLSIDEDISVTIERLKDENGTIFYRVTDKAEDIKGYWYEGRGNSLKDALKDFADDLEICENKAKYEAYNK